MIDRIFKEDGLFHTDMPGFVPRPGQQQMAQSVFESIRSGGKLVCESGTGTGKTYAYLVPAVLSGKCTVISTATRHLQEQIYFRDIPSVVRVLKRNARAALLKGRSNYLCRHRLKLAHLQTDLIDAEMGRSLSRISDWAATTRSGDISEMEGVSENSPVWRAVTSTSDNCLGGNCPEFLRCHVNSARKRAMESDLIVINHHVYFSDVSLKESGFGGLLPEHDAVVFDEAHSLPDIASSFYGFSLSSAGIRDLIQDVESAELEERSGVHFQPAFTAVRQAVSGLTKLAQANYQGPEVLSAVRNREWEDSVSVLKESFDSLLEDLGQAAPAGEGLSRCRDRVEQMAGNLWTWSEDGDENAASWFVSGKTWFRLSSTPLDVGRHLYRHMNSLDKSWVFTSATLSVDRDFLPFLKKVGLPEEDTDTGSWDSPYDYRVHSRLLVPDGMPDPGDPDFPQAMKSLILKVISLSRGRAFCLFTSYAMMNRVHELVQPVTHWPVYRQGDLSKQNLIERFLEDDNAVLFGTSTFWQGVDVKGDALSCVIIDRLPFASPADPVMKSRIRRSREQGGNPFMEIQLPEAVVTLKQGAGRLIRSESDRGVLVICDPRILTKQYGNIFLASLPPMPLVRCLEEIESFFGHEPAQS